LFKTGEKKRKREIRNF